ncbi:MAG: peptidylprolyl isomerase [Terriglobales bacterium]
MLLQAGLVLMLGLGLGAQAPAAAPARYRVRLATSKGVIVIAVNRAWAPHAADRFYTLVRSGYYDQARFFRVIAGRWAQFGIAADPVVSARWRSRTIPDDPPRQPNLRGTVAFAFKDPGGRTTQVFINLRNNSPALDRQGFAPFGRVVQGMAAADRLYAAYGERAGGGIRAGHQQPLFAQGNAYLLARFPRLDFIRHATIAPGGGGGAPGPA